jgi:REase_MTES_1575/Transcriptional regulator, AbiEi antitoxin
VDEAVWLRLYPPRWSMTIPFSGAAPAESALLLGDPFTSREAHQAGLSRKVLRRMVREGSLRLLLKGVYVDAAVPDSIGVRAAAAAKVVPPGSVVCDLTAAWIHGAQLTSAESRFRVPPLEVFRLAGHTRVRRPECTGGTRSLAADDIMEVAGVVVTTPLRTALDLGRLLRRDQALGAIDALLRAGDLSTRDLTAQLERFRGARGVVQLRQLAPLADPRAESPAESLTRLRLIDGGLPVPEVQWEIRNAMGIVVYRLDLAYPELKLAIEYDGAEFHTSVEDRERDERRRAHLRRLGWTIVVLTSPDVYGAAPTAAEKVWAARARLFAAA